MDLAVVHTGEVLLVIEQVLDFGETGCNEARECTARHSDTQADAESSKLDPALLRGCATLSYLREGAMQSCFVLEGCVGERGGNGAENSTNNTRHAVEVMDAAGIVQVDLGLEEFAKPEEATSGDNATESTNGHRGATCHDQVRARADGDTSSESGVENDLHIEFLQSDARHTTGSDGRGGDGEHSVHDDTLLLEICSEGTVERRPEHKEEECANHSDELRVVATFATISAVLVIPSLLVVEEVGCRKAEVSTECVHVHGATHVDSTQITSADGLIKTVEANFECGEAPELEERVLSKHSAHGDQDAASAKVTNDKTRDVKWDLMPVLIGEKLMPEGSDQDGDLEAPSSDEEVEADRAPAMRLEEHHKEAKANEDHDVNILEDRVVFLHSVGSIELRSSN